MEADKCRYCGINNICKLPEEKRLNCKLEFGYHHINTLAIEQLKSLKQSGRNWQKFMQEMDKRDIAAYNEMVMQQRGLG